MIYSMSTKKPVMGRGLEALLGQIYTTVLLARLVSLETVQRDRGPPRQ